MTTLGLSAQQLDALQRLFRKHPAIQAVKLYGSRAKGTFNPRSDVDLAAFGENIDRFLIADVLLDLSDSDLPFAVDLQNYHELKNRQLIDHIDRVGVVIYDRDAESGKVIPENLARIGL